VETTHRNGSVNCSINNLLFCPHMDLKHCKERNRHKFVSEPHVVANHFSFEISYTFQFLVCFVYSVRTVRLVLSYSSMCVVKVTTFR
jgi:hypothetical protein